MNKSQADIPLLPHKALALQDRSVGGSYKVIH